MDKKNQLRVVALLLCAVVGMTATIRGQVYPEHYEYIAESNGLVFGTNVLTGLYPDYWNSSLNEYDLEDMYSDGGAFLIGHICDGSTCNHTTLEIPEIVTFMDEWGETMGEFPVKQILSVQGIGKNDYGEGNVEYYISESNNNQLAITEFNIPNSVAEISPNAFNNTRWLSNQPDGVVYAGDFAVTFKGSATDVAIKEGTKKLSSGIFSNQTGLKTVTIPASVKDIGSSAFSGCTALESVELPNSIIQLRYNLFKDCKSLKNINIPISILRIGKYAFRGCSALESVEIPNSVGEIRGGVFMDCSALKTVSMPGMFYGFGREYYDPFGYSEYAPSYEGVFTGSCNIENLTLIGNAYEVPDYIYLNWSYKQEFAGVRELNIERGAENSYTSSLPGLGANPEVINCYIPEPPMCDNTFSGYDGTLHVPAGSLSKYQAAEGWKNFAHIIDDLDAGGEGVKGDIDGNGSVGVEDVNAVINVMLGKAENPLADVDAGGSVGVEDVNAVINIMLGKQ